MYKVSGFSIFYPLETDRLASIFSPARAQKSLNKKHLERAKPSFTFAMRHWEKTNKKEPRRDDERDFRQQDQDQKKKKLKPVEKAKYRAKGYFDQEGED